MLRYRTEYPNHVHQLTVCVSKHCWLTRHRIVRVQSKSMTVPPLDKVGQSDKTLIVYYIVRDHYSGLIYSEIAPSDALIPLAEFLGRAWARKNGILFCGLPTLLVIPQTVERAFPSIAQQVTCLAVRRLGAENGFKAGVGSAHLVEELLRYLPRQNFEKAALFIKKSARFHELNKSRNGTDTKGELWLKQDHALRALPKNWPQDILNEGVSR